MTISAAAAAAGRINSPESFLAGLKPSRLSVSARNPRPTA